MKIITDPAKLQKWAFDQRMKGKKIALVPTMGYLHDGHLSLIEAAKKQKVDEIVVSIFVNPTQFGPQEDYEKYPRNEKADLEKCKKAGATIVYLPAVKDMYEKNHSVYVMENDLGKTLCGARRPNHFRGVCTVVAKLFNLTLPNVAIFGQKDYQQAAIIRRMVRDLNFNVKIVVSPIVREESGLALSSRNVYLKPVDKECASIVSQLLAKAKADVKAKKKIYWHDYHTETVRTLRKAGLNVDYVDAVDPETLRTVKDLKKGDVVLMAVYANKTRLIDNAVM